MEEKSLILLVKEAGIPVYIPHPNNQLFGTTTGITAQRHDGKDMGEVEIVRNDELGWIRGYGIFIEGFGIKWTRDDV